MEIPHSPHAAPDGSDLPCTNSGSPSSSVTSDNSVRPSKHGAQQRASDADDSDTDLTERPRLPYVVGFSAIATKHEPPEPFGYDFYDTECQNEREDWMSIPLLEFCLSRPDLGGKTIGHETKSLAITSIIRTSNDQGAQLVVINGDMVAKIYDPLYYEYINDFGRKQHVKYEAYGDYSREAHAYVELQKSAAARNVTPAFYGTWTIDINVVVRQGGKVQKHTRHVPLILMQHLPGRSMSQISPSSLPQDKRSEVLKKVLDAESVIYHTGVVHCDFYPRNIMIDGLHEADEASCPTVKVFDFNCSAVRTHPLCEDQCRMRQTHERLTKQYRKPLNPMVRWDGLMIGLSGPGWCPASPPEQWLSDQYHDDERYIPAVWDPLNPYAAAKHVELKNGCETSVDPGLGLVMAIEKGEEDDEKSVVEVDEQSASAVQSS
ncbi:hypothetical protein J4E89_002574 [Alternaria sp. Ai002NY15]|nr:hypothetical protein J4E89_002574 [Alternaria sp. Ai002NY15]